MVLTQKEAGVRRDFFPKMKRVLANVPFAEDVVAAYFCAFDPATPMRAKTILIGALAYFILPLDVVPDFVLGLGFTDDMAVLFSAISMVRAHMTEDHRARARDVIARIRRGESVLA